MSYFKKCINIIFVVSIIRQDMSVIYLLLTLSILVALIFFIAFIYSVKKGQYDDSYTPSVRMLFDDELIIKKQEKSTLD
ncbi:cytochrome oxidase maturation protein, cbb3-type [Polaribacter sp. KT 15]|nr:cytochrome oxidase maturation protein, cbb3-type [Polaribacter sp. KT 15]